MAIDLLNRFTAQQVNNIGSVQNVSSDVHSAEAASIIKSIYAMKAGDTLQGQLVSVNGKDIRILLGEVVTLDAKMDKALFLNLGQQMSFTVNSNKNGKLSLTPLFSNTAMEQNAIKALEAASIPVTDKTIAMAEELMKQGMPINKQLLSTVFREMNVFPDASIEDLVLLHKIEIEVNQENLSTLQLYKSNQQYLFSDLDSFSANLTGHIVELMANEPTDFVTAFAREFVRIFAKNEEPVNVTQQGEAVAAKLSDSALSESETVLNLPREKEIFSDNANTLTRENLLKNETEFLNELFRGEVIKTPAGKEKITETIFQILKEHFLMQPEKMNNAEYVKEFYENLHRELTELEILIKATEKDGSTLGKSIGNARNNIQFMNQINELYHYVQLPIKMNNMDAKGDLYVFKRKEAKKNEDGKLTALLHLAMPTLGKMDVFLSLEEQKLSTKFYMEKEELIDFIEEHIDQLNERLMKKGYQVQTRVVLSNKEERNVMETIMNNETPIPIMSSQAFDARC